MYSLAVSSEDVPEVDYEPNDSPQEAHEVSLGFSEDALLVSEDDVDWFSLTVDKLKQVAIALKAYENGFPVIELYDADWKLIQETDGGFMSPVLTTGTYYMSVTNGYNDSVTKYGLSVDKK